MHKFLEKVLRSPAYPILFSAYPVLKLFADNIGQVDSLVLYRPLVIMIAVSGFLFLGLYVVLRKEHISAAVTTGVILWFTLYGHFINLISAKGVMLSMIRVATIWMAVLVLIVMVIGVIGKKFDFTGIAPGMNLMAIVLLLFPLIKMAYYAVLTNRPFPFKLTHYQQLDRSIASTAPDIYYIILDSYARTDVLMAQLGYDNNDFIEALRDLGFYVARCSQSNYSNTGSSLLSTFNMDYLQNISDVFTADERELLYTMEALQENTLWRMLEAGGYTTVSFATGFAWTEIQETDVFYAPPARGLNEFDVLFIRTTVGRLLDDLGVVNLVGISGERYRQRTELILDKFETLAMIQGPKFVFIHIILPHPPYIYDASGNPMDPGLVTDEEGYVNQVAFISSQIIPRLKILIDESSIPPIIVVQGDHGLFGAQPDMRVKILNAYYLPGHTDLLYSTISPVNTFRLILTAYLDADYDQLPDFSYVSDFPYIYDYSPVENTCVEP